MAMGRRVLPSFGYGLLFGTLFYIVGGVANPIFHNVTPQLAGAVGFIGGITIGLLEKEQREQNQQNQGTA